MQRAGGSTGGPVTHLVCRHLNESSMLLVAFSVRQPFSIMSQPKLLSVLIS